MLSAAERCMIDLFFSDFFFADGLARDWCSVLIGITAPLMLLTVTLPRVSGLSLSCRSLSCGTLLRTGEQNDPRGELSELGCELAEVGVVPVAELGVANDGRRERPGVAPLVPLAGSSRELARRNMC